MLPLLALVWAVDDGEKITKKAPPLAQPAPVKLFALRDEVVAFQVAVTADAAPLDGVTVEVSLDAPGIRVERFVEHFFTIERASSTARKSWSLGWAEGAAPPAGKYTGVMPDALIPVEIAPAWSPWPMKVAAGENGVTWIDLTVPRDQAPGVYRGSVVARAGTATFGTLALELEVLPATLPARPVATMLFYDRGSLDKRIGNGAAAEQQLWSLFRAHRVSPLHGVGSAEDVRAKHEAIAEDGIAVIGTYGTLGNATPAALATVEQIADALAAHQLFDKADVVLYAEDEDCKSRRGAGWKQSLAHSENENARRVRVAWTCSENPAHQPVDVPIVFAGEYDAVLAMLARRAGKQTWIYNGQRPRTGAVHSDTEATSLRTFGWIAAMASIPRWFIWETTFWYDRNAGGHGPYDPFVVAETFHNDDGEASMGDGVLVYPGKQVDLFREHSVGLDGVLPSIRLKNLRRGIEDAGYYQLARASDPAAAERIARALFPRILAEAIPGAPQSWPERGQPFRDARRALADLIAYGAEPASPPPIAAHPPKAKLRLRTLVAMPMIFGVLALIWLLSGRGKRS